MPSTIPYTAASLHLLSFISGNIPSRSSPKSAISDPSLTTLLHLKILCDYLILMFPDTPDTPKSCWSISISLTFSAFPLTLPGHEDLSAKIVDVEGPLSMSSEPLILQPILVDQPLLSFFSFFFFSFLASSLAFHL